MQAQIKQGLKYDIIKVQKTRKKPDKWGIVHGSPIIFEMYNKTKKVTYTQENTKEVKRIMAKESARYFYYFVDKLGVIQLVKPAPTQDW